MPRSLDGAVRFLEETCGVIALAIMILAILIQVVFRYFFTPLIWPFELSIFMYICLIYLGTALAARRDSHVAFDILFTRLPAPWRRVISCALRIFAAAVLILLVLPGVRFMIQSYTIRSASLRIPWSVLVVVYLLGILLMAGHLAAAAIEEWRGSRSSEG